MGLSPQLITKDLYERAVNQLKNISEDNRAAIRLRAIVSAKEHGVNLVAKIFNVTSNTLRTWVKSFLNGDLEDLEYKRGRGRKSKLMQVHYDAIREWTKEDNNITIHKIIINLEEKFKLNTSKSAVHRALHKLNLSYITPRPQHYKQDKNQHPEFKKKSKGGD